MKRIIVDYAKLTDEILNLLVDKFPDGYEDSDIIRFRNTQNELVEAVEVRTHDTIYLVKVSKKLAIRIENFEDEDDVVEVDDTIAAVKNISLDDDIDELDVDSDEQIELEEDNDDDGETDALIEDE